MNINSFLKQFGDPTQRGNIKLWQAALFYAGISAISRLFISPKETKEYYQSQDKPTWAPAGKVFPIAWQLNNVTNVLGSMRNINLPENFPNRSKIMTLQNFIWIAFCVFGLVAFRWKSTLLSALFTTAIASAATAIFILAWKHDRKVAFSISPTALWTLFATPLSASVAYKNKDELMQTPPLKEVL